MLLCHTLKLKSELLLNHYLANAAVLHADNLDATMVLVNNILSVESVTALDVLVVSVELDDACGNTLRYAVSHILCLTTLCCADDYLEVLSVIGVNSKYITLETYYA